MKVLITGGAGFIGSHIANLLIKKNYDVVILDNLSHGKLENIDSKAKFYKVDIRSKEIADIFSKERPHYVIHEAAQINVNTSIENPIEDAEINILGTINLLEACKKYSVKKVIFPASAAIFGEPEYLPIDEKHPLKMISPYGVTKHTVEHYLYMYYKLYGIEYVSLRCSNVYGPRQDTSGEGGVISIFCNKIINNERPIIYGNGEQVRDYIYIEDLVRANLMVLEKNIIGIYNLCTNTKTTVNSLVDIINKYLGKNTEPIYEDFRVGDITESRMSYDKIYNEIGWKPLYDINEGIKNTLLYMKDY